MKQKTFILILLITALLVQSISTYSKNSPDMGYSCAADTTGEGTDKTITAEYAMGNKSGDDLWLCKYKNLEAGTKFQIENCLQYDTTGETVTIDSKETYKCKMCKCDFGLSSDNQRCLENEFRVLHCFQYEDDDRNCAECKYTFNEDLQAIYDGQNFTYQPYTSESTAEYAWHQDHYRLDYGVKITKVDSEGFFKKTECINNRVDGSTRVPHCRVYEEGKEDSCATCHFKEDWNYYYTEPSDNTDTFYGSTEYEKIGNAFAAANQFENTAYWKYKLIRYKASIAATKYQCQHLPLYYETDPARIDYLFKNNEGTGRTFRKEDFVCKDPYKKVTGFATTLSGSSTTLDSFSRTVYSTAGDECTTATTSSPNVGGCYTFNLATGCNNISHDDRISGTGTQPKRSAKQNFVDKYNASGTKVYDGGVEPVLVRDTSNDFNKETDDLALQWKNYGDIVTCQACLTNKEGSADRYNRIMDPNKKVCAKKPDDCSVVGYSDYTKCYQCENSTTHYINYDGKCVAVANKVAYCQRKDSEMNYYTTVSTTNTYRCHKCQFGYGYYKDSSSTDDDKIVCSFNESEHLVKHDQTVTYETDYEIYGLGGCYEYNVKDGAAAFAAGKAKSCGQCLSSAYGFTSVSYSTAEASYKRCKCTTGFDTNENQYSTNYCRKDSDDTCELYFGVDSGEVSRCERCKYGKSSTFDGRLCGVDWSAMSDDDKELNCIKFVERFKGGGSDTYIKAQRLCRICKSGYTPNELGKCVANVDTVVAGDYQKVHDWPKNDSGDYEYDKNPIFYGGWKGCKVVLHYMTATGTYTSTRIPYTWQKMCLKEEGWNDKIYTAATQTDGTEVTKYYKSFHDDSNVDKCEQYTNWEQSRCYKCTTGYINVLPTQFAAQNDSTYKCIADDDAKIKTNQRQNCYLFANTAADTYACRQCNEDAGQNFAHVDPNSAGTFSAKYALGIDCIKSTTKPNSELVTVTSNYTYWKRRVVQCDVSAGYALSLVQNGGGVIRQCVSSPTATTRHCRETQYEADGTTGTDECPAVANDLDVCDLTDDYGYICIKDDTTGGTGLTTCECKLNNDSANNYVKFCLQYNDGTTASYDQTKITDDSVPIACKKCKYGYSISGGKCVRIGEVESALEKCIAFEDIKDSLWNITSGTGAANYKCTRCAPGYVPKENGQACVEKKSPACILADSTTSNCSLCAGSFYLNTSDYMCYEKIPNCLINDKTSVGDKCTFCEPGYGLLSIANKRDQCIISMEGCTEWEKSSTTGEYNANKCKVCDKGCPKASANKPRSQGSTGTGMLDESEYNWRYWGLSPIITVTEGDTTTEYRYCVEGCVKFVEDTEDPTKNETTCLQCASYSDSTSIGADLDFPFYYLEDGICKRRSYISEFCVDYATDKDRCIKCINQYYINDKGQCHQCQDGNRSQYDKDSGKGYRNYCTTTDGLTLDSNDYCVCTQRDFVCDYTGVERKGYYINNASTNDCQPRSRTCNPDDTTGVSYVIDSDYCLSCKTEDAYLTEESGGNICKARDQCTDTDVKCTYFSSTQNYCDQTANGQTKQGCVDTDTSTTSWMHKTQGWDHNEKCCVKNVADTAENKKPMHCQLYNSDSECVQCEENFFLIKVQLSTEVADSKYKLVCIRRPNCKSINNQCTTTSCKAISIDADTYDTSDKQEKYIRQNTQCLACKNNSYFDNYGLLKNRLYGTTPSESAFAKHYCPDDDGHADTVEWYEDAWIESSTCCVKNEGMFKNNGTPSYTFRNIIGCAEYTYTDGSATEVQYCTKCYSNWLAREKDENDSKIQYCYYLESICLSNANTGCKLLRKDFTWDWITCRNCYTKDEHEHGYDINSHTYVCDLYDTQNDGGGEAVTTNTAGQGGEGRDGGYTSLPDDPDDDDPHDDDPDEGDSSDGGSFSNLLSVSVETIVIIAVGLLSLVI